MDYLKQIAQAPHSIGTVEHARVLQYIQTTCLKLGLETSIQNTTSIYSFGGPRITAGEVSNIIARIRGKNHSKAVVVMGHYDSQPNAVGAGDDGAACAAMLESARAIKAGTPLQNDIIFLFTDGEEVGLLGGAAYVQDSTLATQTGLVLNFDSRGNSGINTTFEENPENGWVMKEYIRSAAHPSANSFSYEIYKRLPNYTDYTPFKAAGISGLNSGFIEGYVNYHSITDNPANLDPGSLEHHGSNMVSLVRHFGNMDLSHTKAPDISFFNFVGSILIWYPNSWNLWFVILTNLAFVTFLVLGFRNKKFHAKGFGGGFLIFLLAIVLVICSSILLEKLISALHPSFTNFYNNNHYSSYWYFLVIASFAACVFTSLYSLASKKFNGEALGAGAIFTEVLLMNIVFNTLITASYLLFFPLFFLLAGIIIEWKWAKAPNQGSFKFGLISLLSIVPAILILSPIVYFTFIAFGLETTYNATLILVLLLGMLIPMMVPVLKKYGFRLPLLLLLLCIFGFVVASVKSGYSAQQPMQTNLWYRVDQDSGKAAWISDFTKPDAFTKTFLLQPRKISLNSNPGVNDYFLVSDAPMINTVGPFAEILSDTTINGIRKLSLHLGSAREAISMKIIAEPIALHKILINGQPVNYDRFYSEAAKKQFLLFYHNLSKQGIVIDMELDAGNKFNFALIDRSIGLEKVPSFSGFPENVIPGPGTNSNTIQVVKHFSF